MIRIGHGYDVHRLVENRKLIIGGITIPYDKGLLGHSDADVLVHAICDSLLGAAALPDIGYFFPDSSDEFKDINSLILLKKVMEIIEDHGYKISNIDSTIIAQKPKMRPYIDDMKRVLAKTTGLDYSQINIKATTEEGLGFTGTLEGISAHAVCIIEKEN